MIIGSIGKNEKKIKFVLEIKCTRCGKKVPGGMQTSEKYYGTKSFNEEVQNFTKNYLCGICRDKKRTKRKKTRK